MLNPLKDKSLAKPTKVVRKKAERKQINAHNCYECYNYYKKLNLTDEEIEQKMQNCSRHRAIVAPTKEPDHFWDLDFPSEEEIKKRKMINEKQSKF